MTLCILKFIFDNPISFLFHLRDLINGFGMRQIHIHKLRYALGQNIILYRN